METYLTDKSFTVGDWIKGHCRREAWIITHCGVYQVGHIRWPETNPWAVTPKSNAGFGSSWCVHYGTMLYADQKTAEQVKLGEEQQACGETVTAFFDKRAA